MNSEFENNENIEEAEIISDVEESPAEDFAEEESVPEQNNTVPEFTVTHNVTKKRRYTAIRIIALALVCGLVFGTGFGISSGISKKYALSKIEIGTTDVTLKKGTADTLATSDVAAIAQACMPSVVAITNRSVSDVMTFFGTYSQESTSSGSGIVIGKNETELLIVTNYHVVANSKDLSVVFSAVESRLEAQAQQGDGRVDADDEDILSATVKGYDSDKDLAVIAVLLSDIPAELLAEIKIATIGDSSTLRPGDQVVAIGNALGYGQSVTTGIISAVNRSITMQGSDGYSTVTNTFIQTDAAINQGNSGGALLDMAGNVIGINSVKIATTGVEGMGYAIPISDVESIIDELMMQKTRELVEENRQGYLGITGSDVTSAASQMYGLPVGVYVNSVEEGLAADKAGIKNGYIITKFDGYTISAITQLQEKLKYYEEGEKVKLIVKIPGNAGYEEKEIEVTLSNRSENVEE